MSLKGFHIFFIAVSLVLSIGVGFWAVREYRAGAGSETLYLGVASFVAGGVMAVYGGWFLKKLRDVSFI